LEDLKLLVKAPELAELISLSERKIYYLVAEGKIPSVKVGRNRLYNPSKVLEALEDDASEVDKP